MVSFIGCVLLVSMNSSYMYNILSVRLANGNIYAMKQIQFIEKGLVGAALQEKEMMRKLRHRNICKYIDSFLADSDKFCIIMEYCERGDLRGYL